MNHGIQVMVDAGRATAWQSFRRARRGPGLAHLIDSVRLVHLAAPLVLAASLAAPAARADQTYFGIGLSPGHRVGGDLARVYSSRDEVGGRFVLGQRRGDLAVELSFFGTDLHPAGAPATARGTAGEPDVDLSSSTLSLGAGLKQFVALSRHVELFARVGLDRTWLVPYPDLGAPGPRLDGYGFNYGAGIEAGTRGPGWGVRGWLDLGRQHLDLDALSGTLTSITFGASIQRTY